MQEVKRGKRKRLAWSIFDRRQPRQPKAIIKHEALKRGPAPEYSVAGQPMNTLPLPPEHYPCFGVESTFPGKKFREFLYGLATESGDDEGDRQPEPVA